MQKLYSLTLTLICIGLIPFQAFADSSIKAEKTSKESLVLMPLHAGIELHSKAEEMEFALALGLKHKYKVSSGEEVVNISREILSKTGKSANKDCDDARCVEDVALAFVSELVATAHVSKKANDYTLSLNIQNIFDNKTLYSNSVECKNCDENQILDKLKELGSESIDPLATGKPEVPTPASGVNAAPPVNPENMLWNETKHANTLEGFQNYLGQFPKGKFAALSNAHISRIKEEETIEAKRLEALAWQQVQNSEDDNALQGFLNQHPSGIHAAAAQEKLDAIHKLEADLKAGRIFSDCPDCPEMIVIPAGNFFMGGDGKWTDSLSTTSLWHSRLP